MQVRRSAWRATETRFCSTAAWLLRKIDRYFPSCEEGVAQLRCARRGHDTSRTVPPRRFAPPLLDEEGNGFKPASSSRRGTVSSLPSSWRRAGRDWGRGRVVSRRQTPPTRRCAPPPLRAVVKN